VEDVFGGDGFGADAGFGEGDVFGDGGVEVVEDHEHIKMLVDGIPRKRPRWIGRTGRHVLLPHDLHNIQSVSPPRPLGVIRMNRPPSHRPQRIVRLPALVQCNHMNRDLHILLIRQSQTPIDRRGSRTQILVRFEPARPALQHVDDGGVRIARVALPAESEIEGQVVKVAANVPALGPVTLAGDR